MAASCSCASRLPRPWDRNPLRHWRAITTDESDPMTTANSIASSVCPNESKVSGTQQTLGKVRKPSDDAQKLSPPSHLQFTTESPLPQQGETSTDRKSTPLNSS